MDEIIKKAYLSRLEDCLPVDFSDGVKFGVGLCKDKKYTEKQLLDAMSFAECYIIEHDKPLFLDYIKNIKTKNIKFRIGYFSFKKSELRPEGPVYTDLERYELI